MAILGTATGAAEVTAFNHAWAFMVGCSVGTGFILQGIARKDEVLQRATVEVFVAERESYALAAGK